MWRSSPWPCAYPLLPTWATPAQVGSEERGGVGQSNRASDQKVPHLYLATYTGLAKADDARRLNVRRVAAVVDRSMFALPIQLAANMVRARADDPDMEGVFVHDPMFALHV